MPSTAIRNIYYDPATSFRYGLSRAATAMTMSRLSQRPTRHSRLLGPRAGSSTSSCATDTASIWWRKDRSIEPEPRSHALLETTPPVVGQGLLALLLSYGSTTGELVSTGVTFDRLCELAQRRCAPPRGSQPPLRGTFLCCPGVLCLRLPSMLSQSRELPGLRLQNSEQCPR